MAPNVSRGRTKRLALIISLVLTIAALSGGFLIGKFIVDKPQAETLSSSPAATAGTRFASTTDPVTQARLSIAIIPATGWIKINAAINGIPAGEAYQLFILSKTGARVLSASWSVATKDETEGTKLDGSALLEANEVTAAEVVGRSGKRYVTTQL